ncbi:MAG: 1-(5-phosphoribosyl)-5-[(5-phosphoribosylamino)methylideneamino]imidazole-4-carboxamide isomerase [Eubacterium sp.]|jgi:phosphoribosylformimino-5-aminoimidazole carboxamide ribotide isomerase|nr:1-(5-phosphoribosyl)-5-[(5-phosphoribosylamino)methylideneamino]imidazole-4-carboxamide isomerase [Eubacterium sp.]
MIILPAIDIKDGNCVRLLKGDYNTVEKVADCYLETAERFRAAGARWVHMVDLDGAKEASQKNKDIFFETAKKSGLKVEVGGGIRSLETVEMYLSGGISRVIIGSAAVKNPGLIKTAVKEYGERIAVGIDARNGLVASEGWLETSNVNYLDLGIEMAKLGVKYIVFTDIDKDGTLSRPSHYKTKLITEKTRAFGTNVIASGGVKTINNLLTLKKNGLYGAVCGKSIYSGNLDLKKAIKIIDGF